MQVEPIINARFKQFRENNELQNIPDGEAFEKFVNYTILTFHQPDAFSADTDLLDFVSVGGMSDMGIDGIGIKINGLIIKSKDEIDDIIKRFKRVHVEFIFIQSKYKPHFNKGELNNFVDGVRDFLSNEHHFPMNDSVKVILELKDYLLSDDIVIMWESNPTVSLYYVAMGRWKDAQDLVGLTEHFKRDMSYLNVYEEIDFNFVDSQSLKEIYDSIQNTFTETIDTRHIMPLTDVVGVKNSCIAIVYANEFLKLIQTPEGNIRKSLFNDNVRDFQGNNPVNNEISQTVKTNPEKFILLNNGITIVCDEFVQNNTRLSISNPQIVNGGQTSHVLYFSSKENLELSTVSLSIRFISTTEPELINEIVRGTNRQNIVLEEAFETTKQFHKDLEQFYNAISPDYERVYYERRAKQYQHNPTIKQTQKINLRILTQYFIGMFLNKPHFSHRHESVLLKQFANDIFQDYHSKLPYYATAVAFVQLERLFRDNKMSKHVKPYKAHLLMLLRESVSGFCPNLNREKAIDEHSQKLLDFSKDQLKVEERFKELIDVFDKSAEDWVDKFHKSKFRMKDMEDFTELLLTNVRKRYSISNSASNDNEAKIYRGRVIKTLIDRFGNQCGFISRQPDNIFFHSSQNKDLSFHFLKGKWVNYKVSVNPKNNKIIAIDVEEVK